MDDSPLTATSPVAVRATLNYSADNGCRLDTYFYVPEPPVAPSAPVTPNLVMISALPSLSPSSRRITVPQVTV